MTINILIFNSNESRKLQLTKIELFPGDPNQEIPRFKNIPFDENNKSFCLQ